MPKRTRPFTYKKGLRFYWELLKWKLGLWK